MKWAPVVHIYQPPFQSQEIINEVVNEAYLNIINVLKRNRNFKINLNISGSLTERLVEGGHQKIIKDFCSLAKKGQIEFLASAMYHSILPLIPDNEIERQIKLNYNINRRYFGPIYKPKGFFPPELAFSYKVAKVLARMGFSWVVIDETALKKGKIEQPLKISNLKISAFFREKRETNALKKPEEFLKIIKSRDNDDILITAHDGELWGQNLLNGHKLIERIANFPQIETVFLSEIAGVINTKPSSFTPKASYWFNDEKNVGTRGAYPLWDDPGNEIHKLMWQLARSAIKIVDSTPKTDKGYIFARKNLDEGLSSCSFWWANPGECWHPDMIISGTSLLIMAVRSIDKLDYKKRMDAEKNYLEIQQKVWRTHWLRTNRF